MRRTTRLVAPALVAAATLMLTACNEGEEATDQDSAAPSEQPSGDQGGNDSGNDSGDGKQPLIDKAYATRPDGTGSVLALADDDSVLYLYGGKKSQFTATDGPADGDLCTGKKTEGERVPQLSLECMRGSDVFTKGEILDGYKPNEVRVSWKNSEIEVLRETKAFAGCELQEVSESWGKPCK